MLYGGEAAAVELASAAAARAAVTEGSVTVHKSARHVVWWELWMLRPTPATRRNEGEVVLLGGGRLLL